MILVMIRHFQDTLNTRNSDQKERACGEQLLGVRKVEPVFGDRIAAELIGRPRQTLDWRTPSEAFTRVVAMTA